MLYLMNIDSFKEKINSLLTLFNKTEQNFGLDINKYEGFVEKIKNDMILFEGEFKDELGKEVNTHIKDELNIIKKRIDDGIERTKSLKTIEDTSTFSKEINKMSLNELKKHLTIVKVIYKYTEKQPRTVYEGFWKKTEDDTTKTKCFVKLFMSSENTQAYLYGKNK